MTKYALFAAPLLIACAIGCGPTETQIEITEYDRYCVADSNCVLAIEGDACDCSCDSASINRKSVNRYRDDYSAALAACGEGFECGSCSQITEAFCDDGVCAARVVE